MGLRGTDVAKEAADVVLADDNYITITKAIFEGRKFFDNLQKGIKYYLSVKAALILIFLLPVIAGIPMPMAPIQIILLELFMDLAASAGFVAEPQEKDIYSRPPRDPKEPVLSKRVVRDILLNGVFLFAGVTGVYLFARGQGMDQLVAQTFAFTAWIFGHIFLAFVSRSDRESVFSLGLFSNSVMNIWAVAAIALLVVGVYLPTVGRQLNLTTIPFTQLIAIAGVMLVIMGLLEVKKAVLKGR
jgi:Ca2+-transporting ATPase